MPASTFSLVLLACLLLLMGLVASKTVYANTSYQPVISLSCPDGDFVIDARAYRQKGAGYSTVVIRYRYLGIELKAIQHDGYYRHLAPYLDKIKPSTQAIGFYEESMTGHWQSWLFAKRGETLFLPPKQFDSQQVKNLAECILNNHRTLWIAFPKAKISGRLPLDSYLEKGVPLDGIVALAHADFPLADVYINDWQILLIEHNGRALLYSHYFGNEKPPEIVHLGQVLPAQKFRRKPRLLLQNAMDSALVKKLGNLVNREGDSLLKNYSIVSK